MKIDFEILEIIESGWTDGNLYHLPDVELERNIYLNVNRVL